MCLVEELVVRFSEKTHQTGRQTHALETISASDVYSVAQELFIIMLHLLQWHAPLTLPAWPDKDLLTPQLSGYDPNTVPTSKSQTISQMNRQPNPRNEHTIEKTSQNHRFKTIRKHKTFPTNLQNLQTLSKQTIQTPNPVKTNLLTPNQNTPPSSYRKPNCPTVQKHTHFLKWSSNKQTQRNTATTKSNVQLTARPKSHK